MQTIYKTLLITVMSLWAGSLSGAPAEKDSLRFEVLLNKTMINELNVNGTFTEALDITADHMVLLSTSDQMFLLGWGGMNPLGNRTSASISAFAFTPDSLLMVIRNKELCFVDSSGNLSVLYNLPRSGMGISTGRYVMYLYDQNRTETNHSLYALAPGGQYTKVLEMPGPIRSVYEWNNNILFATGSAVLSYSPATQELKPLVTLPADSLILSLAVDTTNNRVYFSTDKCLYAVKDSKPVVISEKIGGTLRYFSGLIVFDTAERLMIRIAGLEKTIASDVVKKETVITPGTIRILTNAAVEEMVINGLSDDLIIKLIERNKVNFDVGVDATIELAEKNVSSKVIMAMRQAMKKELNTNQK